MHVNNFQGFPIAKADMTISNTKTSTATKDETTAALVCAQKSPNWLHMANQFVS